MASDAGYGAEGLANHHLSEGGHFPARERRLRSLSAGSAGGRGAIAAQCL
jgi:hypothetical protein